MLSYTPDSSHRVDYAECGKSHRNGQTVRICQTHPGNQLYPIYYLHASPSDPRHFVSRGPCNICIGCLDIIYDYNFKDYELCKCPSELLQDGGWQCGACFRFAEWKTQMIMYDRACESCLPNLNTFVDAFEGHHLLTDHTVRASIDRALRNCAVKKHETGQVLRTACRICRVTEVVSTI